MFVAETYWDLMKDPAHWWFEITLIVIFDLLIGALLWPAIKSWVRKHDLIHHTNDCEDDHEVSIEFLTKYCHALEKTINDLDRKVKALEWSDSFREE